MEDSYLDSMWESQYEDYNDYSADDYDRWEEEQVYQDEAYEREYEEDYYDE